MKAFLLAVLLVAVCSATYVPDAEWIAYKNLYGKVYSTSLAESNARYYYAVNKQKITAHNNRYGGGLETYWLEVNQYSDLKFLEFAALFPLNSETPTNTDAFTRPTTAPTTFSFANLGFTSQALDQGRVCNSGWAYAAATAVQLFDAQNTGVQNPPSLSAQNFIDCAGAARSCTNQVPQTAFYYLARLGRSVFPETEYLNTPSIGQGICNPPATLNGKSIAGYSSITNGDDETLRLVVGNIAPVVIKFNPGTFEFMHYRGGVFTQPTPTQSASHYMTVVGYDTTATQKYWLVQNSFGQSWGEAGFIRIEINTAKPIANSAIFPSA